MKSKAISPGAIHTVPADLRKVLTSDPAARAKWEDITRLARNEWICLVISAKKPETRRQHIERVRKHAVSSSESLNIVVSPSYAASNPTNKRQTALSDTVPTDEIDSIDLWTGWQSESVAKRRVDQVFTYVSPTAAPAGAVCCVIHHYKVTVDRHHLDESGRDNLRGWFFENLVPICSDENARIEESRRLGEDITTDETLSPHALKAFSVEHHRRGRLLFAYGCARLGAFLHSPLRLLGSVRRGNTRPPLEHSRESLQFATQCLLSLRGVPPKYGIPLATDTIRRSVLAHLDLQEFKQPLVELIFSLMVAVGAFHRDYGDVLPALRYLTLAFRLAKWADLGWRDPKYAEFMNHVRILYSGLAKNAPSDRLAKRISSDTSYANNLHGKLNLLQWDMRRLSRKAEAEEYLAKIGELEKKYFESGSFASRKFTLKKGVKLSAWDHFAIVTRIGDAYDILGDIKHSDEVMRLASDVGVDGVFAVNRLGRLQVYDKLAGRHTRDKAFSFALLHPGLLRQPCKRSADEREASDFASLSESLVTAIDGWYGRRPRIVLANGGGTAQTVGD